MPRFIHEGSRYKLKPHSGLGLMQIEKFERSFKKIKISSIFSSLITPIYEENCFRISRLFLVETLL